MKITAVTLLVLGTPWRNLTFVKVETDSGLYGLGEVRLANRTNALLGYLSEAMPRYVIGRDPFDIEDLFSKMTMGEVTTWEAWLICCYGRQIPSNQRIIS